MIGNTLIINLVGASASGKSTIAKELEKLGHNAIPSYTTRRPRVDNEWGHTFIKGKLSDNGKDIISGCGIFSAKSMIAYFNSYESGNHYFATDDQVKRGKVNAYTVDPKGAKMVHRFYNDTNTKVVTVYLKADETIRARRLLDRMEDTSYTKLFKDNPQECAEVWGRIRQDRDIFSKVEADYTIDANGSMEETLDQVLEIIEEA